MGFVRLINANGLWATIATIGATLQALGVPDRDGLIEDVLLGHDTPEEYAAHRNFLGATVGRYANRIAQGRFTLDGKSYELATNNGANHLHGGEGGLDRRIWEIRAQSASSVELFYRSPDGEDGYPGNLDVTAIYTLSDANQLTIDYSATTDAPTIVNITNHAFFSLAVDGDAMDQRLTLYAAQYTPVDETLIPTGKLAQVAGTPCDFREATAIGARVRDANDPQIRIALGYDHNYVVDGEAGTLRPAARLEDRASGRVMEMFVIAPGVQFYSGNFFDGTVIGKGGRAIRQGDGIALEPQCFPDSPNRPEFPSARLDPGETYRNTIVLRFSVS